MKKEPKIALVGCGRMGSVLAKKIANHNLLVFDQDFAAAQKLSIKYQLEAVEINDLKRANVLILALPTDLIQESVNTLADIVAEDAVIVNIATTMEHKKINSSNRLVTAKIIGHAKEMELGEIPVILVEGSDREAKALVKGIFQAIGTVVEDNTDRVAEINTIAAKYGILAGLEIKKELEKQGLPEEYIVSAIRLVAAGTMKAFAIGDAGPFAQEIISQHEGNL